MPNEIIVLNLDRVIQRLRDYPDIAGPAYTRATQKSLLLLAGELATYPPAPADSSYDRTGLLGREWTIATPEVQSLGAEFVGAIGTGVIYAEYVQGEEQAWMHVGVWQTAQEIADDRRRRIMAIYAAATREVEESINKDTA